MRRSGWLTAALMVLAAGGPARAADTPANPHGAMVEDCTLCHTKDAWRPAVVSPKFDHGKYGFKITGAHTAVACRACHATLEFKGAGTNCVDCHQDVHKGELGLDCAMCHTTNNFIERAGDVRRHRLTRFPLLGAHAIADCAACHHPSPSGQSAYVNTPTDCERCHADAFRTAKSPDHVAAGYPMDCARCHNTTTWLSGFNHATTGFTLTGAHASLACVRCHANNVFTQLPTDCDSCHHQLYISTATPPHASSGIGIDCISCHSTRAWQPSTFNHANTGFALTGAHKPLPCAMCHTGGVFTGLSPLCVSCHQTNYDNTTNPAHVAAGFPTTCEQCHSTTSWAGATYNHTQFPISSGTHGPGVWSSCATCHINPVTYADFSCFGCHPHSDRLQTDGSHSGVKNYMYDSAACYSCHPRGRT
ncbi:MAG: hypothetical protein HY049_11495 [Acidobacteria bacterium]|nr:hypothetical protein [Acidobacteriota bacterium]